MTIYLTDDAFSVKAKRFNKMFTSISALFFLLKTNYILQNKLFMSTFASSVRENLVPKLVDKFVKSPKNTTQCTSNIMVANCASIS